MKTHKKLRIISAAAILSWTLLPAGLLADPGRSNSSIVQLITPEEAAQPNAHLKTGMFGWKEPSDGPTIEFRAPTPDTEVAKPIPIEIDFKENQAPVDLSTLQVSYLKVIAIDITDRIKPYATKNGIKIEKADLPAGSHRVRFSIRDMQNNLSEKTLKVTIVDQS